MFKEGHLGRVATLAQDGFRLLHEPRERLVALSAIHEARPYPARRTTFGSVDRSYVASYARKHGERVASENPVETGFDEVTFTPRFREQVDAARGTAFGLSHLYNENQRALRFWMGVSFLALAAVPLILVLAWRSSWWLLFALVLPLLMWVASISYGTVARKRMEALHPLAARQAREFLADAARKLVGDAEPHSPPGSPPG